MDQAPTAGTLLAERYRIIRKLGHGGQGAVWLADHITLRSHVAVKVLDEAVAENEEAVSRFLLEARAAAALRSPHVVQIIDHGVDGKRPYIVMELLEGESLAERLDRVDRLSPDETLRIITHLGRALSKAHEAGIVHRDLKPANIFLVRNDDEEIAKVLDFGVAKVQSTSAMPAKSSTRTGSIIGTPYYMSPEQARAKAIDWRSDLWSLAVIAFECLCGRVPFVGDSVGDLVVEICTGAVPVPSAVARVPHGFDAWFERATQRDPAARFQSSRELVKALRAAFRANLKTEVGTRASALPGPTRDDSEPAPPLPPAGDAAAGKELPSLFESRSTAARPSERTPATRRDGFNATTSGRGSLSLDGLPEPTPKRPAPLLLAALAAVGVVGGGVLMMFALGGETAPSGATVATGAVSAATSGAATGQPTRIEARGRDGAAPDTAGSPTPEPTPSALAPGLPPASIDATAVADPPPAALSAPSGAPPARVLPQGARTAPPASAAAAPPPPPPPPPPPRKQRPPAEDDLGL